MKIKSWLITPILLISVQLPGYCSERDIFHEKFIENLGKYSKALYDDNTESFDNDVFDKAYQVNRFYCQMKSEGYDEVSFVPILSKNVLEQMLTDIDFSNHIDRLAAIALVDTFNATILASMDMCY